MTGTTDGLLLLGRLLFYGDWQRIVGSMIRRLLLARWGGDSKERCCSHRKELARQFHRPSAQRHQSKKQYRSGMVIDGHRHLPIALVHPQEQKKRHGVHEEAQQ